MPSRSSHRAAPRRAVVAGCAAVLALFPSCSTPDVRDAVDVLRLPRTGPVEVEYSGRIARESWLDGAEDDAAFSRDEPSGEVRRLADPERVVTVWTEVYEVDADAAVFGLGLSPDGIDAARTRSADWDEAMRWLVDRGLAERVHSYHVTSRVGRPTVQRVAEQQGYVAGYELQGAPTGFFADPQVELAVFGVEVRVVPEVGDDGSMHLDVRYTTSVLRNPLDRARVELRSGPVDVQTPVFANERIAFGVDLDDGESVFVSGMRNDGFVEPERARIQVAFFQAGRGKDPAAAESR